ncbi:unnamed protein product [Ectocarpus sp. CCAP 1310/34]|nr:unnamed protein product [Ectocarpus sp. CCAP 1310/34]
MAKDCSSAAGECLQAAVSGTTAMPRSGSSSVMTPVQHAVKDGSGCDVCVQQRQHSDETGWEIPATKQARWLMKRALEFGGALSGVGGGGSDDEPGGCYCCHTPCGGHSHPLPMAEVVSTRVVVAEGERNGLEVCGVFSHLEQQQQQQQPSADETTKKENLSALVAGIGGGDRCSGNTRKDSSSGGGGGGGWVLLADAVGAPTYAATMMPVGDKGLPPEARPPWELAAAFKLVECESVLPSPRGEAAAGAAAAAAATAAAAAAVVAAAESSPRTSGRKRKTSPGRRGRRRSSAGLPR